MAYQKLPLFTLLVILVVANMPFNGGAIDHLVGGEQGWNMDVNYSAWAERQQFHVGDRLVFEYQQGDHNVIGVDEAGFRDCTFTPTATVLQTGEDVITLNAPGKKWYICGVIPHCNVTNQKVEINVLAETQAPDSSATNDAPPQSSPSVRRGGSGSYAAVVAVTIIAIIVMV